MKWHCMNWHCTNNNKYWSECNTRPDSDWLWVIESNGWLYYNWQTKIGNPGYKKFNTVEEAKAYVMNYKSDINHSHSMSIPCGATLKGIDYDISTGISTPVYSLADTLSQPSPLPWGCKPAKKKEEDNLMKNYSVALAPAAYATVSAPESDTQTKISYLRSRALDVYYTLDDALGKQFKLGMKPGPTTTDELIAAIKDGKFQIDDKKVAKNKEYIDNYGYNKYEPVDMLVFDDFKGPDREGYKLAKEALTKELQKVKDIVNIKDADTALEAIQAFEGWTFTPVTVH